MTTALFRLSQVCSFLVILRTSLVMLETLEILYYSFCSFSIFIVGRIPGDTFGFVSYLGMTKANLGVFIQKQAFDFDFYPLRYLYTRIYAATSPSGIPLFCQVFYSSKSLPSSPSFLAFKTLLAWTTMGPKIVFTREVTEITLL